MRALEAEGNLNELGEAVFSDQIVGYLANRLEVEKWYGRHPEIEDQEIVAPLFGLGLPAPGRRPSASCSPVTGPAAA